MNLCVLTILVLAACSTPTPNSPGVTGQTAVATTDAAALDWLNTPLVNARTGETFTLTSFAGKTVYIEPMATWCTNCRAQLPKVEAARAQLNSDQYVFIGLSVAENVDNTTLANYVDGYGWHFIFAVAPDAFTKGMVDKFGRTAVTPPSTPHFIIRPDGTLTDMSTGSHSTDEIVAELKTAAGG
jgi:thiol-disulfide isomerase/thioredoxin